MNSNPDVMCPGLKDFLTFLLGPGWRGSEPEPEYVESPEQSIKRQRHEIKALLTLIDNEITRLAQRAAFASQGFNIGCMNRVELLEPLATSAATFLDQYERLTKNTAGNLLSPELASVVDEVCFQKKNDSASTYALTHNESIPLRSTQDYRRQVLDSIEKGRGVH